MTTTIRTSTVAVLLFACSFVSASAFAAHHEEQKAVLVAPDEGEAKWAIGSAIRDVAQFNEWQDFSFTREGLIAMLDAAMSAKPEL